MTPGRVNKFQEKARWATTNGDFQLNWYITVEMVHGVLDMRKSWANLDRIMIN